MMAHPVRAPMYRSGKGGEEARGGFCITATGALKMALAAVNLPGIPGAGEGRGQKHTTRIPVHANPVGCRRFV